MEHPRTLMLIPRTLTEHPRTWNERLAASRPLPVPPPSALGWWCVTRSTRKPRHTLGVARTTFGAAPKMVPRPHRFSAAKVRPPAPHHDVPQVIRSGMTCAGGGGGGCDGMLKPRNDRAIPARSAQVSSKQATCGTLWSPLGDPGHLPRPHRSRAAKVRPPATVRTSAMKPTLPW